MAINREDLNSVIIDTVSNLVVVLDREGRLVRFNRACEKMTGRREAEVLGKMIWDLFLIPEEIPGVLEAFANLAAGQFPAVYENYWIDKNGDLRRIAWSSSCVVDDAGTVEYVVGTGLDITERRRAEEAQRLAESRFRRMAASNIVGVDFFNLDGRVTDANDAFLKMVGYTREDLRAGRVRWSEMTPPEYAHLDVEGIAQIRACGVCAPFEKEYIRKDGTRVPILIGAAIFEDTPDSGVCFVLDMTAQKRAQHDLRDSEEKFRLAVTSAPDLMFYQDTQLRFTWMSQTFPPYTMEGVLGKTDEDIIDPASARVTREVKLRVLETGIAEIVQTSVRFGESMRHYESVIQRREAPGGRVLGVAGYVRDITDRKEAENALRDLNKTLEARVLERTAAVQERSIEVDRAAERLRRVAAGARCILWHADIAGRGRWRQEPDFNFKISVLDAQAAQNVLPLALKPNQDYFNAWAKSRNPDDDNRMRQTMSRALLNGDPGYQQEFRCTDRDGQMRWLREDVSVEHLGAGRWRAFGVCTDITDQKEAEALLMESEAVAKDLAERSRRLVVELDHRVRNNLAGLLSLVGAMQEKAENVEAFAQAIESRLMAMVHIHDLLAARGWQRVNLNDLLASLLKALERLSSQRAEIGVECQDLHVQPSQILPLAMIIVEWFTNSCKYGAHSRKGGRVRIMCQSWTESGRVMIRLEWQERGGPPIREPVRPSLGTELVKGFAMRELRGRVTLNYPLEGAEHALEFEAEKDGAAAQETDRESGEALGAAAGLDQPPGYAQE